MDISTRHPSTQQAVEFFDGEHLAPLFAAVSEKCNKLAHEMVELLPDDPELSAGLRKLLEAKDCFVRARVRAVRKAHADGTLEVLEKEGAIT